ncbi:MAG: 16S rRNA (guanine(527)-N(7))-methyltransferase RsmG [Clostridia bacterium]|nr:16S rRNA (guanine(527)-N(7))-methyltransferase RsmG [Clostridia bacterium]
MEELKKGLAAFGITPTAEMIEKFALYEKLLLEWNEKMNLTAITAHDEVVNKHFVDSISCQSLLPKGATLADVGTGAGFPGLPLKIVRPDIKVTLIDALQKRLTFLDTVIEALGLSDIETVHLRAEDAGRTKMRESFDAVTARAVANLPVLCEYCLPLVKKGGVFLALKGRDGAEEAKNSAKALKILGGKIEEIYDKSWQDMEHVVIAVRKEGQTPSAYPRKAGKPQKSPIS